MADLEPFKGLRYSPAARDDLGALLCPPYDVISKQQQEELHGYSPYNAVRLELGQDELNDSAEVNRYTRAALLLDVWIREGVLVPETDSSFYLVEEQFYHMDRQVIRRSLLARVRLEEFSKRIIIPHEETSSGPKQDRLELLKATKANLSPIMGIYRDTSSNIPNLISKIVIGQPIIDTSYSGIHIKVWTISDKESTETVITTLREAPIYVADGHHRYETALGYRDLVDMAHPSQSANRSRDYIMMSLIEIQDPGLLVLPYHRVLTGLSQNNVDSIMKLVQQNFDVQSFGPESTYTTNIVLDLENKLDNANKSGIAIGLVRNQGQGAYILTLKNEGESEARNSSPLERCPTWILGKAILEPVLGTQQEAAASGLLSFTHSSDEVNSLRTSDKLQIGFLLPPMPMPLFEEIVLSGERLPIKSTYFTPKLPTGLVINKFS
jgi:uncharacterized protein (DUF1015 family)